MHHAPQGQSIWGTINTCVEIALDVYIILAKDKDGNEQEGLMVRKNAAKGVLSKETASIGQESGGWLCYGKDTKDIPLYEILQRRLADCKRMETTIMGQMGELKQDGKQKRTDFFGECAPPKTEPGCIAGQTRKVRNGMYLVNEGDGAKLAVHRKIADQFMTPAAVGFGARKGGYIFYDTTASAIALNELKSVFEEAAALVISEDSLYASLHKNYPAYTSFYNQCMPETARIPTVDAPTDLFLSVQLAAEKSKEKTDADSFVQTGEYQEEFGEQVDFGIGG